MSVSQEVLAQVAAMLEAGQGRWTIAKALGISENQARRLINRVRAGENYTHGPAAPPEATSERLLKLLGSGPVGFEQACNQLDCSPSRLRAFIAELREQGHRILEAPDGVALAESTSDRGRNIELEESGEWRKFALVSDTHGGSRHEQLEALHEFYDLLEREGVPYAFHAGDIIHGLGVYSGQIHDVKFLTFQGQVEHVAKNYPSRPSVKTYFILGNHDESAVKGDFGNPGELIAEKRQDMQYCGWYHASLDVGGLRVALQHGAKSTPYALTYHLQKYLEKLPRQQQSPHVYALGHYHQHSWVPRYQGVHAFLPGAFEGRNHLLERLGIYPEPGAWILEARVVDGEMRDIRARNVTYQLC